MIENTQGNIKTWPMWNDMEERNHINKRMILYNYNMIDSIRERFILDGISFLRARYLYNNLILIT